MKIFFLPISLRLWKVWNIRTPFVKRSWPMPGVMLAMMLIVVPAQAHPDPTTTAGGMAWLISALIGFAIVALIWWSARR